MLISYAVPSGGFSVALNTSITTQDGLHPQYFSLYFESLHVPVNFLMAHRVVSRFKLYVFFHNLSPQKLEYKLLFP